MALRRGRSVTLAPCARALTLCPRTPLCSCPGSDVASRTADAVAATPLLAHVLLERTHGKRPAILSGFGLGARVIFDCLLVLAEALKGGDMRVSDVVRPVNVEQC